MRKMLVVLFLLFALAAIAGAQSSPMLSECRRRHVSVPDLFEMV